MLTKEFWIGIGLAALVSSLGAVWAVVRCVCRCVKVEDNQLSVLEEPVEVVIVEPPPSPVEMVIVELLPPPVEEDIFMATPAKQVFMEPLPGVIIGSMVNPGSTCDPGAAAGLAAIVTKRHQVLGQVHERIKPLMKVYKEWGPDWLIKQSL